MKIQRAYKVELKPTLKQTEQFKQHAGIARLAFNWALGERIKHYAETGETLSWAEQDRKFNALKKTDFKFCFESSKWAHQNGIRDCDHAFEKFIYSIKNGGNTGFPKFKSKHLSQKKFRFHFYNERPCRVYDREITLPRIGKVKLKRHGYIPTSGVKINSATVSERAGRWFVSVQVEQEIEVTENQSGTIVGLDLGLKTAVVASDGTSHEAPKFLRKSLKKLKRIQRALSRKKISSNNRKKVRLKLARLHYKIACQRSDWQHKISHQYTRDFATVVMEDLNIKGMLKNRHLAFSIGDAGWYEIKRQIAYKFAWRGGRLITANRHFPSSKTCRNCKYINKDLKLKQREWDCPNCKSHLDRDQNAAGNLEDYGTLGYSETGWKQQKACGQEGSGSKNAIAAKPCLNEAGMMEVVCNE